MNPAPRRGLGAATFLVLIVLFVGLTVLIDQTVRGARLDLTQNRLYTLSPGTLRMLSSIKEPIKLSFYFSRSAAEGVPQVQAYATRVEELLEEFAVRSHGTIRVEVHTPERYSEEEDRAAEAGLRSVPVGAGGEQLYFGLSGTNSTDGHAVIELFEPQKEEFLEYDLARLVHQLSTSKKPVVGLLSSLPLSSGFDPQTGQMRPGSAVYQQISQLMDVHALSPDLTEVPGDVDALMIVHPKGVGAPALYAIDQYLLRGGKILLFVDPDAQLDRSAEESAYGGLGGDRASTLEPLLKTWGIDFDPKYAVGDLEHALMVGGRGGAEPERHLGFMGVPHEDMAQKDPVSGSLDTVNLATPGALLDKPVPGITFEPLLSTGRAAGTIPVARLMMRADPRALRDGFHATGTPYVLAARLSGTFPSAYPGGPPSGAKAPAKPLTRSASTGNVIIVADTDLLSDMLWVRTQSVMGQPLQEVWASNGDFVLNALDNLTGSSDLISIRGRATYNRPFTRVEALREQADTRLRAKEVELQSELSTTEQKLVELQSRRQDQASLVLTSEQSRELERFQQEKLRIRKELREVQRTLDVQIERLGVWLKLINIVLMPALVAFAALVVVAIRHRRRRS